MAPKDISALYSQAYSQHRAIAFFRLPGTQSVHHISGIAERKIAKGEEAFAIAPFDPAIKAYYIKSSPKSSIAGTSIAVSGKVKSTSKKAFTDYVKRIIKAINTGAYQKVVAARIFATSRPVDFAPVSFFEKQCKAYPNAFASLTQGQEAPHQKCV